MPSTYFSLHWLPHRLQVLYLTESKRHEWWLLLRMESSCGVGTDGYRRRTCPNYRIDGCALGLPSLTKKAFMTIEKRIGQWWWDLFEELMKRAGDEGKAIAIANGRYHQGVPAITVIIDGGWSKRSHKHSYNAKSGVGIIIGQ